MANHRMFSNRIANSARFLQMPTEAQLLYFHLVLHADDDGIAEAYLVQKLLGIPSDNFKILQVKGFIRQLNEDQVIVITNWREHNTIRADRKVNSIYLPILKEKYPDIQIIEPKPRADTKKLTGGQPMDVHSPLKLSKVKLSKVNKEPETKEILLYWNEIHNTKYKTFQPLLDNVTYWLNIYSMEDIKKAIKVFPASEYWKDKMTPTLLFRKKNPRGETVDYIGEFLNMKEKYKFSIYPV